MSPYLAPQSSQSARAVSGDFMDDQNNIYGCRGCVMVRRWFTCSLLSGLLPLGDEQVPCVLGAQCVDCRPSA